MLPYWLLFGYFAVGGAISRAQSNISGRFTSPGLVFGSIIIALMIGLRHNVGSDWNAYNAMFDLAGHKPFQQLIAMGDPAYLALNWVAQQFGLPFWGVNLICGTVFAWGLHRLASVQPDPWSAVIIAIPYLVIVVAMGYARQGVAIGILMAGLAHLSKGGSLLRFFFYVIAASLFHRTAVIVLPLALFGTSRGRIVNFAIFAGAALVLIDYSLGSHLDRFIRSYIDTEWTSQGALIRVIMTAVPATLYFLFRNRLGFQPVEKVVWRNFSIAAYISIVLLLLVPSSTVVDRAALYILPLQLAVFSRMGLLIRSTFAARMGIILYSSIVLFVWLNYADKSGDWVPYRYYSPYDN